MQILRSVPTMLGIKETAERTGLSEHYIRTLVWAKKIVYVYTGRKYLINYEKFIDFLNRGDEEQAKQHDTPHLGVVKAL